MTPPIDSIIALILGCCGYLYFLYYIYVNMKDYKLTETLLSLSPGLMVIFGITIHLIMGLETFVDNIINILVCIFNPIANSIASIWPERLKLRGMTQEETDRFFGDTKIDIPEEKRKLR
jgi:hypothetical protein